ncbi:MAG: hypothetical protein ACOH2M_04990 [Cypionkella sp.]
MRLFRSVVLVSLIALSACAGLRKSKVNPFNWFGRSQATAPVASVDETADKRLLIETVLELKVDPFQGGAIIRAVGLPPTQGYWEAELVPQPVDDSGKLVLDFRIFPPITPANVVNQQSREVTVGLRLSNIKLEGISQIVVQGATNARVARR